jgi:hypothetical protein
MAELLRLSHLPPRGPLFVAWEVELAGPAAVRATGQTGVGVPDAAAASAAEPMAVSAAHASAVSAADTVAVSAADTAAAARAVAEAGGTPWLSLVFHTPAPLPQGLDRLQGELRAAAGIAAAAPASTFFQVLWRPEPEPALAAAPAAGAAAAPAFDAAAYAFLLKRAAVALTGAQAQVRVATQPLPADPAILAAFYGEDVAAYLEALALAPAPPAALAAAVAQVQKLDPGHPIVLDALAYPAEPPDLLAAAARESVAGIDLTLFAAPPPAATAPAAAPAPAGSAPAAPPTDWLDGAKVAPLVVLARELAGDLSYDPNSTPTGAAEAWSFVRGKDLALRVIAMAPASPASPGSPTPSAELVLRFPDPTLRRPTRFPLTAARVPPPEGRAVGGGLEVRIPQPDRVVVLGLERATAAERQGVAEKVTVSETREMPVEEILRRLQAFEDAQGRRLDHYSAVDTTHLRFQPSQGANSIEVTLEGPLFWTRQTGADWAWQTLYVNGVRWRGKSLPEIPLIQPEKAAALPLEIHFTKEYTYRLRGSETVDGRAAWVVDFAPAGAAGGERGKLYRGTVWIDRQLYSRLRTHAVQVGLEGEVSSNDETLIYSPIDAAGQPAPWSGDSFVLPLHLRAQQILSVLDKATVVERETVLHEVRINGEDFAALRAQVAGSAVTMVRDTPQGLRYLVKDKAGERVVKEGFSESKLFAVGGIFYDDALNYPLPLAGINYFTFDFRHTGEQVNVFFAGPLLTASASNPRVKGSHFDLGGDLFAIAVPFGDTLYRNGKEVVNQKIKVRPETFDLKLGRTLGDYLKIGAQYTLLRFDYSSDTNTERGFVLPASNFTHSLEGRASFARAGYRLSAGGSWNTRSQWHFWGSPGNLDFSPSQKSFERWDASVSKNWYLPYFQKIGLEVDYVGGRNLDRFSKYQFGFFGGTKIIGFKSASVRAERAYLGHLTYGFEVGQAFRLDWVGDFALANDRQFGLKNQFLAGTGVGGSFMGPWETIVNLTTGVPVAGPVHGFVLYLVFLKLFR